MTQSLFQTYLDLEKSLDEASKLKYNVAIVSVPGMGCSHLLKDYVASHPQVKYINKPGDTLQNFNILDLAFDLNPDSLSWVDAYFHQASSGQAVAVAVNTPYIFQQEDYLHSFFKSHIYKTFWLQPLSHVETASLISQIGVKVNEEKAESIWLQTGGLPQLVKYELVGDPALIGSIIEPILKVVNRCSADDLHKLGLISGDKFKSGLLASVYTNQPKNTNIKINFDLTFSENDQTSSFLLTPIEAAILRKMLGNNNSISNSDVSDIKWGEGKYDKFSDNAINKTMRRLSDKLASYQIENITRVGYKIVARQ